MIFDHPAGLYEACRRISPLNSDYATLPIEEGFDFSTCLGGVHFDRLYLVVFRSVRRATAGPKFLKWHDDRANGAALEAGGPISCISGEGYEGRGGPSFCLLRGPGHGGGGGSHYDM